MVFLVDQRNLRQVTEKEGRSLALKYGSLFEEVSAIQTTQKKIKSMIVKMLASVLHYKKEKMIAAMNLNSDEKRMKEAGVKPVSSFKSGIL